MIRKGTHMHLHTHTQGDTGLKLGEALESTVDAQEWRLEVERVLPSLKVHLRQDNRVSIGVEWTVDDAWCVYTGLASSL